ncbi:NUDIX hydrolase [Paenibacillus lemnae]
MTNQMIVIVKGVIEHQGKILLLQRSVHDEVGAGEWETVGGGVEFGEELEEALIREAEEETGLQVKVEKLLYATTFFTDPHRQIVLLCYWCKAPSNLVSISEEHSNYHWASKAETYHYLPKAILEDFKNNKVWEMMDSYAEVGAGGD